jgi:hypothetical protein
MKLNKTEIFVLVAVLILISLGVAYFASFGKHKNLPPVVSVPEQVVVSVVVPPQSPLFKLDQPLIITISFPNPQNPDNYIVGVRSSKGIPPELLKWLRTSLSSLAKEPQVQQIDEVTHYLIFSNSVEKIDLRNLKHSEIEIPVLKESEGLRFKIHLDKILGNFGKLSEEAAAIARLLRSYEIPCILNPHLAQQRGEETVFMVYASLPAKTVVEEILPSLGLGGLLNQTDFGSTQVKMFLTLQEDGDLINPVLGLPKQFKNMIELGLAYLQVALQEEEQTQVKFWDATVKKDFYLLGLNTKNLQGNLDDIPSNEIGFYIRFNPSSFFPKLNATLNELSDKLPQNIILTAQQSFAILNLAMQQAIDNNPYVPTNLPFFFSLNFGTLSATCEMGSR